MNSIIKLENVCKSYYKKKSDKIVIFDEASYEFFTNKLYLIKGMSGSGKTTLINILGTILSPDSGCLIIENTNVMTLNEEERTNIRRDKIGFVFQYCNLHPFMKAYENVMVPLLLNKNEKNKKEKAIDSLKKVGLGKRVEHYPKELSGGEQQRVSIARALINNPQIILADEPTGSLDAVNEEKIMMLLRKIADDGKCVIIVSHSSNVEKYADYILYIKNKKIVGDKNER